MSRIAIVTPAFNEEFNLPAFYRRVSKALSDLPEDFRIFVVDDGSTDGTASFSEGMVEGEDGLIPLSTVVLSRNFGHQAAITAGLHTAADFDAVIIMDADLQDSPEHLPAFVEQWRKGAQVVYAVRVGRKESFLKVMAFNSFYRIQSFCVDLPMPLDAGVFSLLDRKVVETILEMPESNRYLPGLRAYAGFRQVGIEVERADRLDGKPRVSTSRLIALACNGIFAFSTLPLRIITFLGLAVAGATFFVAILAAVIRFGFGVEVLRWPFGLSTVLCFGGIQLAALGLLGEYIGRIYEEVKRRPNFVIDRILTPSKN